MTLIVQVRHLREADNIVVLGENGTIVEQGNFSSLDLQHSYVQSLIVDSEPKEPQPGNGENVSQDARHDPATAAVESREPQADLLRKTGDMTLYKYYLKSVGWKDGLTILALTAGAIFCTYFPRRYPAITLPHSEARLMNRRALDKNMDRSRYKACWRQDWYVLWSVCDVWRGWIDLCILVYFVSSQF